MELENGFYSSPRWSWEILDCSMPMTFDTYSNCAHQCVYCFAYFQRAVGNTSDEYLAHKVRSVDVNRVKRMFLEPDEHAGQFAWYIKNRLVLQWGGLSDGFDWYERKFRKSLELLKFFREIDYPVSISTKGTWFVDDPEYRAVLKDAKNVHFKYSIITSNAEHARLLEAGTPEPAARFEELRKLNELGVGATTLRYRPFIIGVSDLCIDDMIRRAAEAGCYSVTTEYLCLESRASNHARERYDRMSQVCGFDVWDFYKRNSFTRAGLLRLNYDIKRASINHMHALADKYGLKFFVSDAHHKEASAGAGCCGLPDTGPLSNINRGQYSEAIQIAKKNGRVYWSDIAPLAEGLKNIRFYAAENFNQGTTKERVKRMYQTMFDYMHDVWNNPKTVMSPARYFGGALVPSPTLDANGDIVYIYNAPFVEDGVRVKSVADLELMLTEYRARGEEQREDGQPFGHVAFPVAVPVVGPINTVFTPKALEAARLNYTLFARKGMAADLRAAFPQADIIEVDDSVLNVWDWTRDYYAGEAVSYYWQLAEDLPIGYFKDRNARAHLSALEARLSEGEEPKAFNVTSVELVRVEP